MRLAYWAVTAALGYAGVLKAVDPTAFLSSVLTYQTLPYGLAWLAALYVPYLEIVCAVSLATGWGRLGGRWLTALLLGLFLVLILQAWARGLNIDCGCFGVSETATERWDYLRLVLRDLGLGLLLGVGWTQERALERRSSIFGR